MRGGASVFDSITSDDLIVAFFPCINFCDAKTLLFKGVHISQKGWSLGEMMDKNIRFAQERELYFETLLKLVAVCAHRQLRLVIENPWNTSGETYLQRNFIKPTFVDRNRTLRGDKFVKPTAYWFVCCTPTTGFSMQKDKKVEVVYKTKDSHRVDTGVCSEARSMIHPDYARNFICDFIIGKQQPHTLTTLF